MSRSFLPQLDEAQQSVKGEGVTSLLNKKGKKSQGNAAFRLSPEWLKLESRATTHFVEHKLFFISEVNNTFKKNF